MYCQQGSRLNHQIRNRKGEIDQLARSASHQEDATRRARFITRLTTAKAQLADELITMELHVINCERCTELRSAEINNERTT